jgi:hypothetical protein
MPPKTRVTRSHLSTTSSAAAAASSSSPHSDSKKKKKSKKKTAKTAASTHEDPKFAYRVEDREHDAVQGIVSRLQDESKAIRGFPSEEINVLAALLSEQGFFPNSDDDRGGFLNDSHLGVSFAYELMDKETGQLRSLASLQDEIDQDLRNGANYQSTWIVHAASSILSPWK